MNAATPNFNIKKQPLIEYLMRATDSCGGWWG